MELNRKNFSPTIYYDYRHGLLRQECIDQLISTFRDETPSQAEIKNQTNIDPTLDTNFRLSADS